jgi:hypothetical protein
MPAVTQGAGSARARSERPPARASSPTVGAKRLVSELPAIVWAELREGGARLQSAGPLREGAALCEALQDVLDAQTDFVTVRSRDACVLGTRTPAMAHETWCVLSNGAWYGALLATLTRLGVVVSPPSEDSQPIAAEGEWTSEGASSFVAFDELARAAETASVRAAFVLTPEGVVLCGVGRGQRVGDAARALVQRREPLLRRCAGAELRAEPVDDRFDRVLVATGEGDSLCFGAEIDGTLGGSSVWMVVDRSAGLAVGWASIVRLARGVSTAMRMDESGVVRRGASQELTFAPLGRSKGAR